MMFADFAFRAWLKGVLIVAAAGNATKERLTSHWKYVDRLAFPALLPSVIAIGAVDDRGSRMPGCRYGARPAPSPFMICCGKPEDDGEYYLVDVAQKSYGGTSLAAAIASGLFARGAELRAYTPSADPEVRLAEARDQANSVLRLAVRSPHADALPLEYGDGVLRLPADSGSEV